jgi:hypothetical protein
VLCTALAFVFVFERKTKAVQSTALHMKSAFDRWRGKGSTAMNKPQTEKDRNSSSHKQPAPENVYERERLANAYSADRAALEGIYGTLGPRPVSVSGLAHLAGQAEVWASPESTPLGRHASEEAKNQRQTGRQSGGPSGDIKK